MREGLPGRSLWFAGEHNGPFIAMGTATSAYVSFIVTSYIELIANIFIYQWSGEAVGTRIAASYGVAHGTSEPVDAIVGSDTVDRGR